jgi:hypothetical protein
MLGIFVARVLGLDWVFVGGGMLCGVLLNACGRCRRNETFFDVLGGVRSAGKVFAAWEVVV